MSQLLFENAGLIDGLSDTRREGMHVLVDGPRVAEVSERPIKAAGARRFALDGRTLMPGLIDAHVHAIATSLDLGAIAHEPATLTAARSRLLLEAMLARGFTSVRDAGGADWGLATAVEHDLIKGPRIFYSGRALSQTGGHADFRGRNVDGDMCLMCSRAAQFGVIADGVDAVRRAAREELRKGATQIKIMASGGVASPADPIWVTQYSEEEISAIVAEARSWRTYVAAHAYTPEAIGRAVRLGVRSIEHGNLLDAPIATVMAQAKAFLVPTLVTYDALARDGKRLGFPEVSIAKIADVRGPGLESLAIAKRAGVATVFGTDLLGELQVHQSEEFLIRAQVLPAMEVIRSATGVAAQLLNRVGEFGTVQPGALADLLVVEGDPSADLGLLQEQGRHLSLIAKAGRLYKNTLGA
ncbi:MAG: amidohydrolase family protein [Alphaproteobacteria bacterium]|nr:amidohydrolase family protein [Alphaproteobacteria bacterium]